LWLFCGFSRYQADSAPSPQSPCGTMRIGKTREGGVKYEELRGMASDRTKVGKRWTRHRLQGSISPANLGNGQCSQSTSRGNQKAARSLPTFTTAGRGS